MKRTQYQIQFWAVLTIIVIVVGVVHSYLKPERNFNLELSDFILLLLSTGAIATSGNLMVRGFNDQELLRLLGLDIISIHIGAFATIWLSIKEIFEILKIML